MDNHFINAITQLFDLSQGRVQKSVGKKILYLFWEAKPHERLLFGSSGQFNAGAVLRFNSETIDLYAIKYADSDTYCYRGQWRKDGDIEWFKTEITAGTIEQQLPHSEVVDLEFELTSYFITQNIVDTLPENDQRGGYFIPLYP